jgi:hypothetical protein
MKEFRRQFLKQMSGPAAALLRGPAFASSLRPPARTPDELKAGWLTPPRSYRPHTRWWWSGGAVTREGVARQLERMRAQGLGGVEIMHCWRVYAKGNLAYLSEQWLEMVRYAIEKAAQLDMEVALTFGSGWIFGGFWVPPEHRSKVLAPGWVDVSGPGVFDDAVPDVETTSRRYLQGQRPEPAGPDEHQIVAVAAGRLDGKRLDCDSLLDLTAGVENGRLRWKVPDGRWRIMAFRLKYTGQQNEAQNEVAKQWVVDHLSKAAVQRYCDYLGGAFLRAFGKHFGMTVDSFFCDSFEISPLPNTLLWSNELLESFRIYKGYELTRYLPAIWWDIGELTPKIRYDINEFLHWLGLETTFRTFVDWCASHHVQARIQPHYRFTEELIQGAGATARPETEVTTTRFEVVTDPRKATAAGARFYGREVVSAEAYTFIHQAEHYVATLEEMKIAADAFLRDGVTQFYDAGCLYLPEMEVAPARDLPSANGPFRWWKYYHHLTAYNSWWKYYHHLTAYNSRCCFLLRQGTFVADVLVYSPQATVWTQRALFGTERRVMPYGNLGKTLVANGYDFDPVNDDVLQNHARIEKGRICIRDQTYRSLILPKVLALPVETLEFIVRFAREGGSVIALDQLPSSSVGLRNWRQNDARTRQLVGELFGADRNGRAHAGGGRTYFIPDYRIVETVFSPQQKPYEPTPPLTAGQSRLLQVLRRHVAPDFALEGGKQSDGLTFIHRRIGDLDVYFVTNLQPKPSKLAVSFGVSGKRPERWDPMRGQITPVRCYRSTEAGTEIPVDLAPWESMFVVFSPGADPVHVSRTNLLDVRDITETAITGIAAENGVVTAEIVQGGRSRAAMLAVSDLPGPFPLQGKWKLVLEARNFLRVEKEITRLESWTADPQTRHFSGTGVYELNFDLPKQYAREDLELVLHLGSVGAVAEVILNGRNVGVRWMQPYRLDITGAIGERGNNLKVLVTNTLANSVAGMKEPPEVPAELVPHYSQTSNAYGRGPRISARDMALKNLPDSGLMGPVEIVPRRRVLIPL